MTLQYQFKKAFVEQESEKYIEYLCDRTRTKPEVYAAIEKIKLLHLEIKNCERYYLYIFGLLINKNDKFTQQKLF